MGDYIQLPLVVCREIDSLEQVLAQRAIGILVGSALPGAVRIGKEYLDRGEMRQPLKLRHLFAPITGQHFLQWGGYMSELVAESLVRTQT